MSSTIFYRKLFIKVSETEVIPFFEAGSSNCYDCGIKNRIGRRSRDWQNRRINGKTIVPHTEVLSYVTDYEKSLIEHYNDNHDDLNKYTPNCFGWYVGLSIGGKSTSKTTYNDYKNFFMGGIKKALTIEELVENNIVISLIVSPYSKDDIVKNGLEMKPNVNFNSTQQLIDTINEYTEYYKNVPNCFYLTTVSEYSIGRFLKNNNKRVKKEKQLVTLKEYYVIRCPNGHFLSRLIKTGYRYSFYLSHRCKMFATLEKAESYLKSINREGYFVSKISNEISLYM